MKKLLKILLWALGVVVALVLLATIILWIFFPAEQVKQMAVSRATEALGREVSVGDLSMSFWGGFGVELQDVKVANLPEFSESYLLEADYADLKLSLLPLISGEYEIDRLVIEKPRIILHKLADGTVNYDFTATDSADTSLQAQQMPDVSPEAGTAVAAISFDGLRVVDGYLRYIDDSTKSEYTAEGLHLNTSVSMPNSNTYRSSGEIGCDKLVVSEDSRVPALEVNVEYALDYDVANDIVLIDRMRATVDDIRFNITGRVLHPLNNPDLEVNFEGQQTQLKTLLEKLPDELLNSVEGYDLNGDLEIEGIFHYTQLEDTALYSLSGSATIIDLEASRADIDGILKAERCLADFGTDEVRVTIEDGSFDGQPLKGHVVISHFENTRLNGELAGHIDLAFVQPFLPAEDSHRLSGQCNTDIKFVGTVSDFANGSFSGNVQIDKATYYAAFLPDSITDLSASLYFDNQVASIRELSCKVGNGTLQTSGRVKNLVAYLLSDSSQAKVATPEMELHLTGDLDLQTVNAYLPDRGAPSLTGRMALDMDVQGEWGNLASVNPHGNVKIINSAYQDEFLPEPIENFSVDLDITRDTVRIQNLAVAFQSSDFALNGTLIRPFPYLLPFEGIERDPRRKPFLQFTATSSSFDVDRLFPEAVPGSAADPTEASPDSVSMVFLPDIDGQGSITCNKAIYSEVEFSSINGNVKINDRKIALTDASAQVYTGTVTGNTTIDLNDFENPKYTGAFEAKQIEANGFLTQFTKVPSGLLTGKADFNGSYTAAGWEPEQFLTSLDLYGDFLMREGMLNTEGPIYKLLSELASRIGESFSQQQPLRSLMTHVLVEDGRVKLDKLTTKLDRLGDLELTAAYSFNNEYSYSGDLLLSREMSEKLVSKLGGGLGRLLGGGNTERISIPFKPNSTEDPTPQVDWTAMGKDIGGDLKDQASDLLKNLFKK